jgi:MFS family permease
VSTALTESELDETQSTPVKGSAFTALRVYNFRLYAHAQLVSNVGGWVQRIAQDWLVLTITGSPTAVGITTALQFLPTLMFGLYGGLLADRYDKRKILLGTQVSMSALAAVLAVLTLSHGVQAWHVYLVAFGLGLVTAVDNPTRQAFVSEMVGPDQIRNAISLNASFFQLGALIGPAISGVLINVVGSGYAFAINSVSFIAPFVALWMLREDELYRGPARTRGGSGTLREGIRYVINRPEMRWPTVLVGVFGFFTINFPVTLSAYAKTVFHSGASGYGLLSSALALGSMVGALMSARRADNRLRTLVVTAALLAVLEMLASAAPDQWSFIVVTVAVGAVMLTLLTSCNSSVQMAADDSMRGRVMGVYLLVFIGSGAIGGPVLGAIDEYFSPQLGLFVSGLIPALVTIAIAIRLSRDAQLRVEVHPSAPAHLLVLVPR